MESGTLGVRTGDCLGRGDHLLLERVDLCLYPPGVGGTFLHSGPLALLDQFHQLELDTDEVVLHAGIDHGPPLPEAMPSVPPVV